MSTGSVRAIRRLFKALADAIEPFHRAGFILCDFKIGNFGFVGKQLVIFDFDATCTVAESLFVRRVTFTQWYVATEVWRDGILTSAADVFSLGHALQVVSNLARTSAFNDLIAVATAPDRADRLPDMATFKAVLKGCNPVRNAVKAAVLALLALGALIDERDARADSFGQEIRIMADMRCLQCHCYTHSAHTDDDEMYLVVRLRINLLIAFERQILNISDRTRLRENVLRPQLIEVE